MVTCQTDENPSALRCRGAGLVLAEAGCRASCPSWVVAMTDEVRGVTLIAGSLPFERSKSNCALEMPDFLVCGSEHQAVRFEISVDCLFNVLSSNYDLV